MAHINSYISSTLESILMQQNTGQRFDFGEIVTTCTPVPAFKMLEINSNPFGLAASSKDHAKKSIFTLGDNFYNNGSIEKAIDGITSQQNNCKEVHSTLASLCYAKVASSEDRKKLEKQIASKVFARFKAVKFMGSLDEVFTLKMVPLGKND